MSSHSISKADTEAGIEHFVNFKRRIRTFVVNKKNDFIAFSLSDSCSSGQNI